MSVSLRSQLFQLSFAGMLYTLALTTLPCSIRSCRPAPALSVPRKYLSYQKMTQPKASSLKYLLVLDFEATCGDGTKSQEIIEFPTLLYNFHEGKSNSPECDSSLYSFSLPYTDKVEATFHEYVRPTVDPRLTSFCTGLTGITQVRLGWTQLSDSICLFRMTLIDNCGRCRHISGCLEKVPRVPEGPWNARARKHESGCVPYLR